MQILIGGHKGGAGKSTLCLLLANYLATTLNHRVRVVDLDPRHPLSWRAARAARLSHKPPYPVIAARPEDFPRLINPAEKSLITLVDLPGILDDDQLQGILSDADLVLCPFGYDELSVDATVLFAMVIRMINFYSPLVFVPNRVKHSLAYQTRDQVSQVLKKFGVIISPLPERIDFQRVSTFHTPENLLGAVNLVMEEIYRQFIKKQLENVEKAQGS